MKTEPGTFSFPQTPSLMEGQYQSNVIVGTLADNAGANSVASNFSASFTTGSMTYGVWLVPDSANDGGYNLVTNVPGQPNGTPTGTLYVSESNGSQSLTTSAGVSFSVAPYNTLGVDLEDASMQAGQTGAITIASYTDDAGILGGTNDPSTYSGTLTLSGQTYPVTFAGGSVQTPDLSSLNPGSYTGSLSATSVPGAGESDCSVSITVAEAPPSDVSVQTINATKIRGQKVFLWQHRNCDEPAIE